MLESKGKPKKADGRRYLQRLGHCAWRVSEASLVWHSRGPHGREVDGNWMAIQQSFWIMLDNKSGNKWTRVKRKRNLRRQGHISQWLCWSSFVSTTWQRSEGKHRAKKAPHPPHGGRKMPTKRHHPVVLGPLLSRNVCCGKHSTAPCTIRFEPVSSRGCAGATSSL
jgi:hypothetical protein